MWRKKLKGKTQENTPFPHDTHLLEIWIKHQFHQSSDIVVNYFSFGEMNVLVSYIDQSIDTKLLSEFILQPLLQQKDEGISFEKATEKVEITSPKWTNNGSDIISGLLSGAVLLYCEGSEHAVLYNIVLVEGRNPEKAETESLVFGPKVAFTESLSKNLNLIRTHLNDPQLTVEEIIVGERAKKPVSILYIKDITNEELVQTFRQRITDLHYDHIMDSTVLAQLLEDNSQTIFPQILTTELPDRLSLSLLHGKVGVLVDGSPTAIIGPSTFLSFFESTEDVYMRWNMGTFLRMLRFLAIFLSVLLTPAYVAVLTYHYEVIPSALLISLGQSRANVPFPPFFEALLLEFIIELLREAGARLPTKVGQTIGIVGGIVIGQASVQAGITSNILIIIIALSALGSFTTPSYLMGTAIRITRFPIIILAALWGGVGIMLAFCFIIIHLLRLTTIGVPYLSPIYPLRLSDLRYSLFRVPQQYLKMRPASNRPLNEERYTKRDPKQKRDIDQ
ncbi:spore germination protein [Mangrovibacillus cuniculi]|uniref:Spore germination protein n=1 Tax=Mangrovibacillus cuniculi TaxID=2593652 RepID=A0A7S8CAT7_9BACI|nr:spore germination protein [Mangrovibacillus cuniculi]QPC46548.1 spore germination protein [Mangrovibacillus cuniculi]